MLTNVPTQINRSARLVTLRHPNGMECTIWRKEVNRAGTGSPTDFGGVPTIEGMGVISSEDEADYDFTEIGDAKVVFCGQFQTNGDNWMENDASLIYADMPPIEALIECKAAPEAEGFFTPDKNDMVTVYPGNGVVMSYQIVGTTGSVSIPPYTRKYVLAPLQDKTVGV